MGSVKLLQLRIPPEVYERMVTGAKAAGLSVNAYAVKLLGKARP